MSDIPSELSKTGSTHFLASEKRTFPNKERQPAPPGSLPLSLLPAKYPISPRHL